MSAVAFVGHPRRPAVLAPVPGPRANRGRHHHPRGSWLDQGRRVGTVSFVIAFLLFGSVTLARSDATPTGDEPHYLLDALSIATDGDRDLTNQFGSAEQLRWATAGTQTEDPNWMASVLAPHGRGYTEDGLVSWHSVAMSTLLTPGVWLDWGGDRDRLEPRLIMAMISALAAMALALLMTRLRRRLGVPDWAVVVTWLGMVATLPLLAYSDQIYPETPALACTALAVALLVEPRVRQHTVLLAGALAWLAPWFHVRFAVFACAITIACWVRLRGSRTRYPGWPVALPPILSMVGLAATWWIYYGSPSPTSMAFGDKPAAEGLQAAYLALAGGFVSSDWGLVPYAPVYLVGLAAVVVLLIRAPRWGGLAVGSVVLYLAVMAFTGSYAPGFSYFARYFVIFYPFLGVAVMIVLAKVVWVRFLATGLLAWSLVLTVAWVADPGWQLLNGGEVELSAMQPTEDVWPDMGEPPAAEIPVTAVLDQEGGSGDVGAQVFISRPDSMDPRVANPPMLDAVRTSAREGAGLLGSSDRVALDPRPAAHVVFVHLASGPAPPDTIIARVQVMDGESTVVDYPVPRRSIADDGAFTRLASVFPRPSDAVSVRVWTSGATDLVATRTEIIRYPGLSVAAVGSFPDLRMSGGWALSVLAVGIALWLSVRRADRRAYPPAAVPAPLPSRAHPLDVRLRRWRPVQLGQPPG